MDDRYHIRAALRNQGWFRSPGAYVLVDGQFGSTGKGALAALFGELFGGQIDVCTTNAGPNSGHVGYIQNHVGDRQKVMTQQIPVASVVARALHGDGGAIPYLNAGAIINPITLRSEAALHGFAYDNLFVHPNAAIIDYDQQTDGAESTDKIASTNKGVGRALARKVMRESNVAKLRLQDFGGFATVQALNINLDEGVCFVETAQGFSLGINQPFYPFTTSRDCSVGQALADAAIPFNKVRKVVMTCRTFPIRVGSTDKGNSGDCYADQQETTWEALGLAPELTTITKRVRRVFTWSRQQFRDAVRTNQPSLLFLNFFQYLPEDRRVAFVNVVRDDYRMVMGCMPEAILLGYGPYTTDVKLWEE